MARTTHASACRGTSASKNKTRLKARLLCSTLILITPAIAAADDLPTGANVAAGNVSIATPGAQTMTITQGSDRAVVNWDSFSVGAGASVDIRQPSSTSAILNRVTGSTDSRIHGRLTANGQVHLVNPNGIFIGKTGRVETGGGFVASTLDVMDGDFMQGRLRYGGTGRSAQVTNRGAITVGRGGYAALIGGRVDNAGTVVVPLGKIGLAAGERVTLDVSGDGFLQVALPSEDDGNPEALIANSGRVSADGGLIEMKAATARNAARNAINLSGVAEARSVSVRNGAVVLGGGGGGAVRVTGRVSTRAPRISSEAVASSLRPQPRPTGGRIDITGTQIALAGAEIDASGDGGGGLVRIGGDFAGAGPLARADTVTVDSGTTISVDALGQGDGGRAVIWSDLSTEFSGRISARGGAQAGDGGFVEVSSARALSYSGLTDLRAPAGDFGSLLLDPDDIFVPGTISEADVEAALSLGNLTLDTAGGGSDPGDIIIRADIDWTTGTTFELVADRDIDILGAINGSADPAAAFVLSATGTVTLDATSAIDVSNLSIAADTVNASGSVFETGAGGSIVVRDFNMTAGTWRQAGPALSTFAVTDFQLGAGASFLRVTGGSGTVAAPYILTDVYGLQGMDSVDLLDSHFALGGDIDATSTDGWGNSGEGVLGFNPIGTFDAGFSASLEGNGFGIDGLYIARFSDAGLFYATEASASISDLVLSDVDISGDNAGGLVANNAGSVSNVDVTGAVTGVAMDFGEGTAGGDVGGLAAINTGTISGASFDGTVDGTGSGFRIFAGGLVGSNGGTISDSSADGAVTASADTAGRVGGFAGINTGTILDSGSSASSTLSVTTTGDEVASRIGGFAATNAGAISGSEATGDVTAFVGAFDPDEFETTGSLISITPGDTELNAGGFVGDNLTGEGLPGTITASRAENSVYVQGGYGDTFVGDVAVGGFAGRNAGSISNARADSDVSVLLTEDLVSDDADLALTVRGLGGGFAGVNSAALSETGATGSVTLEAYHAVQQLVGSGHSGGNEAGQIADSYAEGPVDLIFNEPGGTGTLGGFVGRSSAGSLSRVYASGAVTPPAIGTILSGGLIGESVSDPDSPATSVTASYWDTETTGQSSSAGGTGLATAAFEDTAGFVALAGAAGWDFDTVWAPGDSGFHPAIYSIDQVIFARPDPVSLQYGETVSASTTGSVSGGPSVYVFPPVGDSLDSAPLFAELVFPSDDVGTGTFTLAATSLTSALGESYRVVDLPGSYTITPAPLSITADDQAKTYGEAFSFAGTEFTTSGLLFDDQVDSVDLASLGAANTATVDGAPYAITASDASGSGLTNYTIAYVDGAMTVDPAALTITADDQAKTYGEAVSFAGTEFTTSGLLFEDSVDSVDLASLGAANTATVEGAPYAITASDASGSGLTNYTIAYVDGAMTVDPAALTITADDQAKTYGEAFSFAGTEFTTSGLLFDDSVDSVDLASLGAANTATVEGAPYAITASDASGSGLTNYTIAYVDGAMTVDPAALTITADDQAKTYGEAFS
ncbi:MBG domain-containing protein, partial [Salipiger bermudensis]|uniref:two-partner secretion domain-containing protein n=1 Tax=Salipiger bermudensis TaxID=344736 RepID=UPI001CD33591